MGLGAAVAAAPPSLLPAQEKKDSPLRGPGAVPVELAVNGRKQRLEVEPRVTLLDALRDRLDVTGPKKVCDRAECGACSVLRDGKLIYACTALAIDCEGSEITTPEGLAPDGDMHPAARAFVECDGFQCGFCTPGQVIALKALLDKHPKPTPEQVRIGMSGNLCRCGAYVKIRRAAETAAAMLAGGR
jgi:xanthine dehydrogenase YagT iron-sulfur-binding subunit